MIEKTNYRQFSLDDWLHHIQHQHWRTIELKLDRVSKVWNRLQSDEKPFVFAIAGTNGKGSCVAMLDAVLQAAGLKTGSYTSPHLVRYNERICINGNPVEDQLLVDAFCKIETVRQDISLTYFEYSTLCALIVFQHQKVDVSILETGMGGRLDAVNIIDNDVALITSIGLDHVQWLGSDHEKIGFEKAGIIKPQGRAVCAQLNPPTSISTQANDIGALLLQNGNDYNLEKSQTSNCYTWTTEHKEIDSTWRIVSGLMSPLFGQHQAQNMGGVIAALAITAERTGVTVEHLHKGLANTKLAARCQIISKNPLIILDVAHNADSANELGRFLKANPVAGNTHAIFGILEDKSLKPIIAPIIDQIDYWNIATLHGERGQSSEQLETKMRSEAYITSITQFKDPTWAYNSVRQIAKNDDRIVIFGSFYTVGDIIKAINQIDRHN